MDKERSKCFHNGIILISHTKITTNQVNDGGQ